MKQNKYFNLGRFVRLFRQDLILNKKAYLFTVIGLGLAIYSLTYLTWNISRAKVYNRYDYIPLLIIYLMDIGVFIGTSFPALKNHIKTSNYILSPGSIFEKYMVQFTIRIVIFIPVALLLFWLGTHAAKASLIPNPETGFNPSKIPNFYYGDLFEDVKKLSDKFFIILSIFSFATILFAGAVWFKRYALVKTLIVVGIMVGAYLLILVLFSHIFYPEKVTGFEVHVEQYSIAKDFKNVQALLYSIGMLSWVFLLPLAYFKLKEKEV